MAPEQEEMVQFGLFLLYSEVEKQSNLDARSIILSFEVKAKKYDQSMTDNEVTS